MRFVIVVNAVLACSAVVCLGGELKLSTDFAGGSVGQVSTVSELHLRVGVKGQADQDGRNRQASWYSFRVSGAGKGKEVILDLVDLPGEYNYQANRGAITKDTRPYWREKNGPWVEAPGDYDAAEPKWRLRIQPKGSEFYVAHIPPYAQKSLELLRKTLKPVAETWGNSLGGRQIEVWTFDLSKGKVDAPVVWVMFRQHAWEAGTGWVGDGFMKNLQPGIVWKILPQSDPDGVAEGGVRFNKAGYDLNRNWDAANDVAKRPEILAEKTAIEQWLAGGKKIDLFLSLHNTETGEYLEGPPESKLGRELWAALKERTTFDPDREYFSRMKVEGAGRANVIQWLWGVHKQPAFLMELRVGMSKKLGERPGTESWSAFGAGLAREIAALVLLR